MNCIYSWYFIAVILLSSIKCVNSFRGSSNLQYARQRNAPTIDERTQRTFPLHKFSKTSCFAVKPIPRNVYLPSHYETKAISLTEKLSRAYQLFIYGINSYISHRDKAGAIFMVGVFVLVGFLYFPNLFSHLAKKKILSEKEIHFRELLTSLEGDKIDYDALQKIDIYQCVTCDTQFRPAKGRVEVFLKNPRFQCPRCHAPNTAFYNIYDYKDTRAIARLEKLKLKKDQEKLEETTEGDDDDDEEAEDEDDDDNDALQEEEVEYEEEEDAEAPPEKRKNV
jgi:DNA-directed RNA polymerase subunit RPC12/RpoP